MSRYKRTLTDDSFAQAAECLGVLAHKDRLKLIDILLSGQHSVGELAELCEIPQSVTSDHLRLMQRCGFLTSSRNGRFVYYEVVEPHLKEILHCIRKRFAGGREDDVRN